MQQQLERALLEKSQPQQPQPQPQQQAGQTPVSVTDSLARGRADQELDSALFSSGGLPAVPTLHAPSGRPRQLGQTRTATGSQREQQLESHTLELENGSQDE